VVERRDNPATRHGRGLRDIGEGGGVTTKASRCDRSSVG
jgi:hypothetical protein